MPLYLSKSDFQLANSCPAKLFYRKQGYPVVEAGDDYVAFLADGGYMVETIAQLLHPEGIALPEDVPPEVGAQQTLEALRAKRVTLFGATLLHGACLARADILIKRGNTLQLIEVKTKAYNSTTPEAEFLSKRGVKAAWRPYLMDVTFQAYILRQMFPQAKIVPYLCLPDQARTTSIDQLFAQFTLAHAPPGSPWRKPQVTFTGDVERLRADHFLAIMDVTEAVARLEGEVAAHVETLVASLNPLRRLPAQLTTACRDCEYRVKPTVQPNGFQECWQGLAHVQPHILEMFRVGQISEARANTLIAKGQASLYALTDADLQNQKGEVGAWDRRRRIQRDCTRRDIEWFSPALEEALRTHTYPLHFIDFETSRLAVPYHAGMRPYEIVAFQWSCHTLPAPGAPLQVTHAEWINLTEAFPNFAFAQTLAECLGQAGTVFTWSHHENTTLREVQRQLSAAAQHQLAQWLAAFLDSGRLVDLCALATEHYFHPGMGGRVSLKAVLPAVWPLVTGLHQHPHFARYYRTAGPQVLNPYLTLPALPFQTQTGIEMKAVHEGTGAMRAYQEMLYGFSRTNAQQRENWRRLLLQYCELDTAAMVAVWWHWATRCGVI